MLISIPLVPPILCRTLAEESSDAEISIGEIHFTDVPLTPKLSTISRDTRRNERHPDDKPPAEYRQEMSKLSTLPRPIFDQVDTAGQHWQTTLW